jgi:hypothetical protein
MDDIYDLRIRDGDGGGDEGDGDDNVGLVWNGLSG